MNCFIPRFDLEEDSHFYYLYGEVPGAKVEDITIEAHGEKKPWSYTAAPTALTPSTRIVRSAKARNPMVRIHSPGPGP